MQEQMSRTIHKVIQRPETTDAEVQLVRNRLQQQGWADNTLDEHLGNIEARLTIAEGATRDAQEMFATTLEQLGYERAYSGR